MCGFLPPKASGIQSLPDPVAKSGSPWAMVQVPELLEPGLTAYMCGPVLFMAGVQDELAALGFDTARLYQESFAF